MKKEAKKIMNKLLVTISLLISTVRILIGIYYDIPPLYWWFFVLDFHAIMIGIWLSRLMYDARLSGIYDTIHLSVGITLQATFVIIAIPVETAFFMAFKSFSHIFVGLLIGSWWLNRPVWIAGKQAYQLTYSHWLLPRYVDPKNYSKRNILLIWFFIQPIAFYLFWGVCTVEVLVAIFSRIH